MSMERLDCATGALCLPWVKCFYYYVQCCFQPRFRDPERSFKSESKLTHRLTNFTSIVPGSIILVVTDMGDSG